MKFRKPKPPSYAALTVLGFLLISVAAGLLGAMVSPLCGAGFGVGVLGLSFLVLGWLAEPDGGEGP